MCAEYDRKDNSLVGMKWRSRCKRAFDLMIAIPAIVCLLPLLCVLAALVKWHIGSPVIFRQQRPGYLTTPFYIFKFRTMTNLKDEKGNILPDADRLRPLGRFLRSTSLDELPELFNVIKGDMSLVGPRPLLMEYLPYYTDREMLRHTVRPGITGFAQVHGRNYLCWDDRLEMDAWYVENWSLILDIKILFKTFIKVVVRDGIAVDSSAVEPNFRDERASKNYIMSSM